MTLFSRTSFGVVTLELVEGQLTQSYEFAHLLIYPDLRDEVEQGFAEVSEGGNPGVGAGSNMAKLTGRDTKIASRK